MRNYARSICLLTALIVAPAVHAQEADREVVRCSGQRVSAIYIVTRPPFPASRSPIVQRAARMASKLHEMTKPSVIRRYLALEEGKPCTEQRRVESERILRAQPFLADAKVVAYADGPGAVIIAVTTVDEVSLILDGAVATNSPHIRAIRIGEANLFGAGVYSAVRWADGRGFRDEWGARFAHYQLFGRPYQLVVQGARRTAGEDWSIEASHPYLTDLQRISWRANYGMLDGYTFFERAADTAAALSLRREFGDIGGVIRVGIPGISRLLTLVGGSLSFEHAEPGSQPVIVAPDGIRPDTSSVLVNRYSENRQTRANVLFGIRELRFMEAVGFDALDGVQDVAKGLQFSALLGRGVHWFDRRGDHGLFASVALFAGTGSPSSFASLDASLEGRRDSDAKEWTGVISSARLAHYLRPSSRHTMFAAFEWSGGWKSRIPFQLTFADREGGLRGYRDSHLAGGRRLVARFEDRHLLRRLRFATLGFGAFLDAGKLWAGDAPFGVNSRVSYAAGVSLFAGIPPGSQRVVRLDFAYPLNPDVRRSWEIRLVARDVTRRFWKEPRDVRRVRERSVPANVFNWP